MRYSNSVITAVVAGSFMIGIALGMLPERPTISIPIEVPGLIPMADRDAAIPPDPLVEHDSVVLDSMSTARKHAILRQVGRASWYGEEFEGKPTASGKPFKRRGMTCAHRYLPLGTKLHIVNLENGRTVNVTVTDRGPFIPGRVIDLSEQAARLLDMRKQGLAKVAIFEEKSPPPAG